MKLRSKFSILMIFAVAIPIIICVAITYFSIKNSITKIEIDNSKIKIQNTQNYINSLIKSQEDTLGSWLPWTEFFTHVKERDIELIKIDLGNPKENSPTEILGVLDKDYNPIYFSDTAPEEWTSMNFKDFDFVKGLKGSTHFFSNIETYKGETYLVGIAKITHDNDDEFKDFAGYLILARKINAGLLEKGKNILGIDFAIRFNSKTFSTKKDVKFLSNDIPKEIQAFSNVDSQKMTVVSEAGLEDSLGKHIGTIHVESISTQGVKALNLLLICFVVILIVMLICSMGITSVSIEALIIKPLNDIIKVTEDTSKGNLAVKVDYKSRNEIGKLSKCINIMIDSLRKILNKVVESSDKIASLSEELSSNSEENSKATEQISNSVQEMLQGAEKQSDKVIEASETISKLLNSIEDVSSNAQLASDLSIEALSYAQEGNKTVQTLEKEMNTINEEVSNSAVVVEELGDQSKEISKIIDIIKHIADQTNLLSLNAAIEAARAGEYGRSFAVVASEIRKLANQSEEFTKQIEEILNNIEKGASKAVESMKHGTEEVKKGTIIVNEAGMTFKKILLSVEKASNQIQEISGLIQGMAQDSKYISNSMNEVLDIANFQLENTQTVASTTEEQFASMEEIASSANILADMAQELRVLVENFKV